MDWSWELSHNVEVNVLLGRVESRLNNAANLQYGGDEQAISKQGDGLTSRIKSRS